MGDQLEVKIIARVHSCYREKFGIPRQPGLVDRARASIEFFPPYNRKEMFKEIEKFSHIWVHFLFHEAVDDGWKTTVRPPALGGQQRVGVFASRSPHRPNHFGLSVVRLYGVKVNESGVSLDVGGGDFLDNTPVIDIKPYVPYSDCVEDASAGYSGQKIASLPVAFTEGARKFCEVYKNETSRDLQGLIEQVLAQDPRPASQRNRDKRFGMQLWEVDIRWRVEDGVVKVLECVPLQEFG